MLCLANSWQRLTGECEQAQHLIQPGERESSRLSSQASRVMPFSNHRTGTLHSLAKCFRGIFLLPDSIQQGTTTQFSLATRIIQKENLAWCYVFKVTTPSVRDYCSAFPMLLHEEIKLKVEHDFNETVLRYLTHRRNGSYKRPETRDLHFLWTIILAGLWRNRSLGKLDISLRNSFCALSATPFLPPPYCEGAGSPSLQSYNTYLGVGNIELKGLTSKQTCIAACCDSALLGMSARK